MPQLLLQPAEQYLGLGEGLIPRGHDGKGSNLSERRKRLDPSERKLSDKRAEEADLLESAAVFHSSGRHACGQWDQGADMPLPNARRRLVVIIGRRPGAHFPLGTHAPTVPPRGIVESLSFAAAAYYSVDRPIKKFNYQLELTV